MQNDGVIVLGASSFVVCQPHPLSPTLSHTPPPPIVCCHAAATNFPEALDSALTRPGRFDFTVHVGVPDVRGREEILNLYLGKIKVAAGTCAAYSHLALGTLISYSCMRLATLCADIDAAKIARATPGMTGADLEAMVNQAALLAVQRGSDTVSWPDLDEAKDKLTMGMNNPTPYIQTCARHS